MSLQEGKPENEKETATPEPILHEEQGKDPQDTDELSEESLDEASGGLIWQMSPTSGSGQYSTPTTWTTPKS